MSTHVKKLITRQAFQWIPPMMFAAIGRYVPTGVEFFVVWLPLIFISCAGITYSALSITDDWWPE